MNQGKNTFISFFSFLLVNICSVLVILMSNNVSNLLLAVVGVINSIIFIVLLNISLPLGNSLLISMYKIIKRPRLPPFY